MRSSDCRICILGSEGGKGHALRARQRRAVPDSDRLNVTTSHIRLPARISAGLRRKLSVFVWHFLASAVPALAGFFLTPILVHRFGAEGFADWAMIEPLLLMGAYMLTLGSQSGALNYVATEKTSAGAALTAIMVIFCVTAPLLFVFAGSILSTFFSISITVAILLCSVTEALAVVTSNLFRAMQQTSLFALSEGGRWAILLAVVTICAGLGLPWITDPAQLLWTRDHRHARPLCGFGMVGAKARAVSTLADLGPPLVPPFLCS